MRRTWDTLIWVVLTAAISGAFCLSSCPDVEASLGIPACAGRSHLKPCRLCDHKGQRMLPPVIDANNVRFITPDEKAAGEGGF